MFHPQLLNAKVIFETGHTAHEGHVDVIQDGDLFVLRFRSTVFTVDYRPIEGPPECSLQHRIPFHEFRKLANALSAALRKLDHASHVTAALERPATKRKPSKRRGRGK